MLKLFRSAVPAAAQPAHVPAAAAVSGLQMQHAEARVAEAERQRKEAVAEASQLRMRMVQMQQAGSMQPNPQWGGGGMQPQPHHFGNSFRTPPGVGVRHMNPNVWSGDPRWSQGQSRRGSWPGQPDYMSGNPVKPPTQQHHAELGNMGGKHADTQVPLRTQLGEFSIAEIKHLQATFKAKFGMELRLTKNNDAFDLRVLREAVTGLGNLGIKEARQSPQGSPYGPTNSFKKTARKDTDAKPPDPMDKAEKPTVKITRGSGRGKPGPKPKGKPGPKAKGK